MKSKKEQFIKNQYNMEYYSLSDYIDVSNLEEGNQLYLFSMEQITTITNLGDKKNSKKFQQILNQKQLDYVLENPHLTQSIPKKATTVTLVRKEILEDYRKYGHNDYLRGQNPKKEYPELDFLKDIHSPEVFVVEYKSATTLNFKSVFKTSTNEYYCEPFSLNYSNAELHDGKYHLDELIEHLSTKNNLAFCIDVNRKPQLITTPFNDKTENIEKIIEDIPSYNISEKEKEAIHIIYYPTTEELMKLKQWDNPENKEYNKNKEIYTIERFILSEILGASNYIKVPLKNEEPLIPARKYKKHV